MDGTKFLTLLNVVVAVIVVSPAVAQQQQMVEVSLTDIKEILAKNIHADMARIPLMIQVPPEIAAKVCNTGTAQLKPEANNAIPSCPAKSTSGDLEQAVKRQIAQNDQK
ncbi:hypothetical protein ACFQUU_21480 [Herbaspirillum sp. GCM10030257]|uniref:hypothetical protein n=1 Tax=Herbaspirillum sp. GCM10030257 TaxID=3273393 RepID=UPI003614996D